MLIRRIHDHQHLNGVIFVMAEFILVAGAAVFIAWSFARRGNMFGTLLGLGIALNCLIVVGFAIAAYRRGERGAGISKLASSSYRAQVARDYPSLSADTLALTAAALVPYCLTVLVGWEGANRARRTNSPR